MLEALDAGVVADVVHRPPRPEELALRRQLSDQVREAPVVRIPPGLGSQDRDRVGRDLLPVDVEGRSARIEEDEPRRVGGRRGPAYISE